MQASMQRWGRIAATIAGLVVLVAAGCAKPPPEERVPAPAPSATLEESTPVPIESEEVPQPTPELGTIYFDFDSYAIRDDAKPILRANARAILDHPEWRQITLEGHCDERGSEEYNLALGQRRAESAKTYLVNLGVPPSRLATVSFGESVPAVQGHDESAWRWNRRVEFRVTR